ncbi:DASS family sodium-coupled anion symporter [Neobacillus niacini]
MTALAAGSFVWTMTLPASSSLAGLNPNGWRVLAVLTLAIILWFTMVIPATLTSLLVVLLLSTSGALTFDQAALSLGQKEVWLVFSMLIFSAALTGHGLDKRIAYYMLMTARGNLRQLLFMLMLFGFMLTFFMTNAFSRLSMLLPIAAGLVTTLKDRSTKGFAPALYLLIVFVPYISSTSVITGSGGAIYAAGLFQSMLNFEWSYLQWLLMMAPISLLTLILLWGVLVVRFKVPSGDNAEELIPYFKSEMKQLGAMKDSEKKLLLIALLLAGLWMTSDWHGMTPAISALAAACALFFFRLISWKEAVTKIDWGVIFMFAAGFAIADGLRINGVVDWLFTMMPPNLNNMTAFSVAVFMLVIFTVIRIGFTNNTAMVASLMPLALLFAQTSPHNTQWIGMITLVACSNGYFFPTQSSGSMLVYQLGSFSSRNFWNFGVLITILMSGLTLLFAFFFWPIVGLNK